jgi:hypothetical protein
MLLVKDQAQADASRRFCCLGYGSTSATKQKFSKQEIQSPTVRPFFSLLSLWTD